MLIVGVINKMMGAIIQRVLKAIYRIVYIIYKSAELFILLPLAMLSQSVFNNAWNRYYTQPLEKSIFNLCVQWLLFVGEKVNMSYTQINVLIFCIVWPIITISSILLNIILLFS